MSASIAADRLAKFVKAAGKRLTGGVHVGQFERAGVIYGYVTNGNLAVARPLSDWAASPGLFPCALGIEAIPVLLWPSSPSSWSRRIDAAELHRWCGPMCEVCHGWVTHDCACGHRHECDTCDGDVRPRPGGAGEVVIDRFLLSRLLVLLEAEGAVAVEAGSLRYAAMVTPGVLVRCTRGVGMLAGMNPDWAASVEVAPFPEPQP